VKSPKESCRKAGKQAGMSDFARQQADFQRGILTGDDTVLAEILDSPKEKRETLYASTATPTARAGRGHAQRSRAVASLSR